MPNTRLNIILMKDLRYYQSKREPKIIKLSNNMKKLVKNLSRLTKLQMKNRIKWIKW